MLFDGALVVEVVLNPANDLFEDIFRCDDARKATVLVMHDRNMVAILRELLQQYTNPLTLKHRRYWAQQFTLADLAALPGQGQ